MVNDGAGEVGRALAAATAALALHTRIEVGIAVRLDVALVAVGVQALLVFARLAMPARTRFALSEYTGATMAPGLGDEAVASVSNAAVRFWAVVLLASVILATVDPGVDAPCIA